MKPLAIDLFCGLGGWSDGLIAEGYEVVGYDIEAHEYGDMRYPGKLVIQDVLTLHGSQFKDAALIVASAPCQEYSYMAMPWKLAKAKAAAIRADTTGESLVRLNRLFKACFRIQAEASLAAGRHIPMIVENVRGAQPWVGRARFNFGSFFLWGDVPALMPITLGRQVMKAGIAHRSNGATNFHGHKVAGFRFDGSGKSFQSASVNTMEGREPRAREGRKGAGAGAVWFDGNLCQLPSASPRRKAASAMIARIPLPLARYIGATFRP